MLSAFLLPEQVSRENGQGPLVDLGEMAGKRLTLTLGITRIIEQQSLDVSVSGSPDGQVWEPVASFPQKFYCGDYSLPVDLGARPDLRFLRAEWRMHRWGRGTPQPLFGFFLHVAETKAALAVA